MKRLRAFAEIAGSVLDAVGNEKRLLSQVADAAADALQCTASVWLLAPGDDQLEPAVLNHADPLVRDLTTALSAQPPGEPTPTMRLQDGQPVLITADADSTDLVAADLAQHGQASMAALPMLMRGRLLGAVCATREAGAGAFHAEEIDFGLALAGVAAATIVNARMIADSSTVVDELRHHSELMDHISDAMISCDADWRIVSWNLGAERVYGYPRGEALGCDLFALLATEFCGGDGMALNIGEVVEDISRTGGWRGELHERRADGAPLTIMASLTALAHDAHGPTGLVVVNRDVTDQRREEHQALHDALTGLPNRRLLTNRMYDALARANRTGLLIAVLFLDLDGFKPVNDRYGHAAGDEVLRATAHRLTTVVRTTDVVARLGGDEFVVVLEDAGSMASVSEGAQRIIDSVAIPVQVGTEVVSVRPSIGIAFGDGRARQATPEALVHAADAAMYVAKRQKLGLSFAPDLVSAPVDVVSPAL